MRSRNCLTALLLAPTVLSTQVSLAQTQPAKGNLPTGTSAKPAVVRVIAGCSGKYSYGSIEYAFAVGEVGTGFFINPDGYIATNNHLLRPAERTGCEDYALSNLAERISGKKDNASIPKQTRDELRNSIRITSEPNYFMRVVLPTGDSFPFEVKKTGRAADGDRGDMAVIKIQLNNAPTLQIVDPKATKLQNKANVIGYPLNGGIEAFFAPLLTGEFPASQPLDKVSVIESQIANSSALQDNSGAALHLNARLSPGTSGSPVLDDSGKVVGMVVLDGEETNSSVSAAVPASSLLPFITEFSRNNQESPTDKLYQEGLGLFEAGDFKGAKAKFEQVKGLFPYHSEVFSLIRESDQRLTTQDQATRQNLLLIGLGVGGMVALVGYFVTKRNRGQAAVASAEAQPFLVAPESNYERESLPIAVPEGAKVISEPSNGVAKPGYYRKPAAVTQVGGNGSSPTIIGTQPFVELKNQDGHVKRFYLSRDRYRLGRDRAWCDLYIADDGWEVLSRRHAVLEREGDDYRIFDGDRSNPSTNGLRINGVAVTPEQGYLLKDGDELQTGHDSRNQVVLVYSNPGSKS